MMWDRIRKFLLSPAGYALYDALVNRPDEFSAQQYTLRHIRTSHHRPYFGLQTAAGSLMGTSKRNIRSGYWKDIIYTECSRSNTMVA